MECSHRVGAIRRSYDLYQKYRLLAPFPSVVFQDSVSCISVILTSIKRIGRPGRAFSECSLPSAPSTRRVIPAHQGLFRKTVWLLVRRILPMRTFDVEQAIWRVQWIQLRHHRCLPLSPEKAKKSSRLQEVNCVVGLQKDRLVTLFSILDLPTLEARLKFQGFHCPACECIPPLLSCYRGGILCLFRYTIPMWPVVGVKSLRY